MKKRSFSMHLRQDLGLAVLVLAVIGVWHISASVIGDKKAEGPRAAAVEGKPIGYLLAERLGVAEPIYEKRADDEADGLALIRQSALPGAFGTSVIVGDAATHFRFLGDLLPGDRIRIKDRGGVARVYEITDGKAMIAHAMSVGPEEQEMDLVLTTRWPLDGPAPADAGVVLATAIE